MDMASTEQRQKTYRNWMLLAQFVAVFVIVGLLFQSSLAPLFTRWIKWDEELSHGIPTLLALLYLAFHCQELPFQKDTKLIKAIFYTFFLIKFSIISIDI